MKLSAKVTNRPAEHQASVSTDGRMQTVSVPAKTGGPGSAVNGGELLCLALATCYCNDLYREAATLGIAVDGVEVEVDAEFGGRGEAAKSIRYRVEVRSSASPEAIQKLIEHTDRVAEVHNTLRNGSPVALERTKEGPARLVAPSRERADGGPPESNPPPFTSSRGRGQWSVCPSGRTSFENRVAPPPFLRSWCRNASPSRSNFSKNWSQEISSSVRFPE